MGGVYEVECGGEGWKDVGGVEECGGWGKVCGGKDGV